MTIIVSRYNVDRFYFVIMCKLYSLLGLHASVFICERTRPNVIVRDETLIMHEEPKEAHYHTFITLHS